MGMADDLLKIRTKRFWGQRILGGVHKAQVERRRGGGGAQSSPTECWIVLVIYFEQLV